MPLPASATKVHLDEATDDPRQARIELAALTDKFNALLTFLGLSTITSTPATVGEGLEINTGALRARLNGTTLLRSGSGLSVNVGAGANLIPQLDASGRLVVGTILATLDAQQQFRRSGVVTPAQITADQNNYAPTGIATASRLRIASDAARNITGLSGGAEGREIRLTNIGSFTITLTDDDVGSTVGNRFLFGADFALAAGKSVNLFYDDTLDRWLTDESASAGGGGAWDVLEEKITTNVAAADFVLVSHLAAYEDFQFIFSNVIPATDLVDIRVRTSTNGGSTYDAGASDYAFAQQTQTTGGVAAVADNSAAFIQLNGVSTLGNLSTERFSARLTLTNPAVGWAQMSYLGFYTNSAGGVATSFRGGGMRVSGNNVDAIRFYMSSGNIGSGKITMLGRRKAS